jgi:diguanylate cyclase (GGDEF)-like protein
VRSIGPPAICLPGELTLCLLERELQARRWHLGFAPVVEARFEADAASAQRQQLIVAGLIGLVVYNLFLLNDALARPEVLPVAMFWRLGVFTPYGLVALALVRRGLPPRWAEAVMASAVVVAMLAACMIFWRTPMGVGVYDPFAFGLILMAGNISLGLRFVFALGSTVLALLIAMVFMVHLSVMPDSARMFAIGQLLGTAVFTLVAGFRIERGARQSYLLMLREEIRSEAATRSAQAFALASRTDALTGLANRRAFDVELSRLWLGMHTHQGRLAAILVDIDHFKRYNDCHGHPAGDECLRQVAAAMRAAVRDGDLIARVGGEEFVVLLPGASVEALKAAAERLRRSVEDLGLPHDGQGDQKVVTISLGAALAEASSPLDEHGLIQAADTALYEAKRHGRNRWEVYRELVVA